MLSAKSRVTAASYANAGVGFIIAMAMLLGQGCTAISIHDRNHLPAYIAGLSAAPPSLAYSTSPIPPALPVDDNSLQPLAEDCQAWFERIDKIVDAAGTRDAGEHRLNQISGFPHLRIDRFAASFRQQLRAPLKTEPTILPSLLWYARDLDIAARANELQNLPQRWQDALGIANVATVRKALDQCSQVLVRRDLSNAALPDTLFALWQVPDHYAKWKRALGLYPLTSMPFFHGVANWQRGTEQVFLTSANANTAGTAPDPADFTRYQFDQRGTDREKPIDIELDFSSSLRNRLGIPQLSEKQWQALLARHAPIFEVETKGAFDRLGEVQFSANARNPPQATINSAKPTAYQRIGYTRIAGKTHAQLTYSIWFSERPKMAAIDLLAGRLDSVILRITLDHDGLPMLVDSIHGCGCYHLFFPTPKLNPIPAPAENTEWAFVPKTLPAFKAGQRVSVRIASGTHYLSDIRIADAAQPSAERPTQPQAYALRSERELLSLPLSLPMSLPTPLPINADVPNANKSERQSIFAANGLIAGSERGERLLFWPMGILSPGAMRQWGTHATAFVGTRHFDDADLIDKRFRIVEGNSAKQIQNMIQSEMIDEPQK